VGKNINIDNSVGYKAFSPEFSNKTIPNTSHTNHGIVYKKGFLLGENTIKMIIAVLCILILAFLLSSLYNIFTEKKNLEKAGASLGIIVNQIRKASAVGESGVLLDPRGWVLAAFSANTLSPGLCENKNCICICDTPSFFQSSLAARCNSAGVCTALNELVILKENGKIDADSKIEIDGPINYIVKMEDDGVSVDIER